MHTRTYDTLYLTTLTPEQHARTCHYWYTITTATLPHVAFTTRAGLMQWLGERDLRLTADLPAEGTWSTQRIDGVYHDTCHMSYDTFYALGPQTVALPGREKPQQGVEIKVVSNGQVTMGIVTTDDAGICTVHSMNPNCHYRPVSPYASLAR